MARDALRRSYIQPLARDALRRNYAQPLARDALRRSYTQPLVRDALRQDSVDNTDAIDSPKLSCKLWMTVNVGHELTRIVHEHKPFAVHEKVDRLAWEVFLAEHPVDDDLELHHHLCHGPVPWTWAWDNGELVIEFDRVTSVDANPDAVASALLAGHWWREVNNLTLETDAERMRITGRCEHIPVLIRGGDEVDRHSMFFLGMLAFRLGSMKFFVDWLAEAADLGEPNAQQMLGRYLMTGDQKEEALYWLARSVLEHNDDNSVVGLCSLLWHSQSRPRVILAEAILKSKSRDGHTGATMELGCLYMVGAPGVKQNRRAARQLLRAAAAAGSQEAADILTQFKTNDNTSWTDVLITAGVSTATVLSCFYVASWLFRKRK